MIDLAVDPAFVPPVYRAWAVWEQGDRRRALEILDELVSRDVGGPLVTPWDGLLESEFLDRFPAGVQRLLAEPLRLHVPPAAAALVLWRQAPCNDLLSAIVLADLRWSDDPFESSPTTTPGAEALAATLARHIEMGLISRDPSELPDGGRPVLSEELLAVAEADRLGPVFDALAATASYGASPGWWELAMHAVPNVVVRMFIHHVFRRPTVHGVGATWSAVESRHPDYALAVRRSIETVDGALSEAEWREAATVLARQPALDLRRVLRDLVAASDS